MCSRGEAVFKAEEAAAVTVAEAVGASAVLAVLVAPGLRDDSIFNTDDDDEAGTTGGSGRGGGGGGDPGGVVPTAESPEQS